MPKRVRQDAERVVPKNTVLVAGYADREAALGDLDRLEPALTRKDLHSGGVVVVSPTDGGRLLLVRTAHGPRSPVLFATELVWWIVEPIWFWLSTAFLGDLDAAIRRKNTPELKELEEAAGKSALALVASIPAARRDALAPLLERAATTAEWTLRIRWKDITSELGLGWIAQRRLRRSSKARTNTGR